MTQKKFQRYLWPALLMAGLVLMLAACDTQGGYAGAIAYQKVLDYDSQIFVMDPLGEVKTRVSTEGGWNFMPSWSPDGDTLAYFYFDSVTQITTAYAVDLTQAEFVPKLLTDTGTYDVEFGPLKWSPDGETILYYTIDALENADIYKINVATGEVGDIFTDTIFYDYAPTWAPDGTQFAFASNRPDKEDPIYDLYLADENGENLVQLTDNNSDGWVDTLPAWSPDGGTIAFWRYNYIPGETFDGGPEGIWLMDLESGEATLLLEATLPSGGVAPVWSPDGHYLAFLEDVDGQHTLQVFDFEAGVLLDVPYLAGDKRAISWSPGSKALVFSNYNDPIIQMYILDISSGELIEILEADPGASIGDPHWGGN